MNAKRIAALTFAMTLTGLTGFTMTAVAAPAATVTVPCAGPGGGEAGLDAAIVAANVGAGAATIVVAPGCRYTLTHEADVSDGGGLPAITSTVAIVAAAGRATTIARAASASPFSILNVDALGALTVRNVTVTGGVAPDGFFGGGIGVGAGAALTLEGARVTGNTATSENAFIASGGGIGNYGSVTLVRSRVDHNVAINRAPGNLAVGGGITSEGTDPTRAATLVVRDSSIDHNEVHVTAGDGPGAVGAGIANLGIATMHLEHSSVFGNVAEAGGSGGAALGGGIFDNLSFFTGAAAMVTTIDGGSIWGNVANAGGGGFAAGAAMYDGAGDHTTTTAVSLTGNAATASGTGAQAQGGAVYEEPGTALSVGAETRLLLNLAHASGASSQASAGGIFEAGDPITLAPTTHVALNWPNDCAPAATVVGCT